MLTQERLKERLTYDLKTGFFTRKYQAKGYRKVGTYAGTDNGFGYLRITIDGKNYLSHRLAFLYVNGGFPDCEIDHINHDKKDNRWENLRLCSRKDNARNASISRRNTSGFTGVVYEKGRKKWRARIMQNSKSVHLGYFDSRSLANKAYMHASNIFGYHKNHGSLCNKKRIL